VKLEFEIFFEEKRHNLGAGRGRNSTFRVWATKAGRKSLWRNQTFFERKTAVAYFNLLRRTLNAPDEIVSHPAREGLAGGNSPSAYGRSRSDSETDGVCSKGRH
jgi:hypothetical protein